MLESSSTFVQGLYVMFVGMGVVFAALTLVMLAIMALDRVFKAKVQAEPAAKVAEEAVAAPASARASDTDDEELVAAIALALALRIQQAQRAPTPAPVRVIAVEDEPSLWAAVGKLQ